MADGTRDEARAGDPTLRDVYGARLHVAAQARRTPLIESPALSRQVGVPVLLKLENLQVTGAFKVRGAASKLASLTPEERARGVVAVSTGNHGRAVAHVGRALGVRVVVCVSSLVQQNKLRAIEELGAEVVVHGASQDEAMVRAAALSAQEGLVFVPPFDDPAILAGQGTVGLEIVEERPDVREVLVPLSGGGLLAGVAVAVKGIDRDIRVVGVSAERVGVMVESLRRGRPVELPEQASLADSLGGGLGDPNRYTFRLVRELVDEHAIVTEEAIGEAMRFGFREHQQVLEGAGAVGIAALRAGRHRPGGGPIAVVVSGGNVDPDQFLSVVS